MSVVNRKNLYAVVEIDIIFRMYCKNKPHKPTGFVHFLITMIILSDTLNFKTLNKLNSLLKTNK